MLAPFHYIGVTDYTLSGEIIDDTTSLSRLVSDERVDYLLEKTNYYGYSGDTLHGLIFVSRISEGQELALALNARAVSACSDVNKMDPRGSTIRKKFSRY